MGITNGRSEELKTKQQSEITGLADISLTPSTDMLATAAAYTPRIEVAAGQAVQTVSRGLLGTEDEYRVAIAQISTYPGQIKKNTEKIISYIQEAKAKGAKLVVFPELAIPGYCAMDLLYNVSYLKENLAALDAVRKASAGINVVVGFCDVDFSKVRSGNRPWLYNSAAVISDGKVLAVQDKTLLPNYEIFFEDRYFAPPRPTKVVDLGGLRLGTEICEDLWTQGYEVDPAALLVDQGANLIVNISASPFHIGKLSSRLDLIKKTAQSKNTPLLYANLVGSFDGYEGEVVFDGRSLLLTPKGEVIGLGKGFREDLLIVDINHAKELILPEVDRTAELHEALVLGIKDYFYRLEALGGAPIIQALMGVSGGIDSAIVAALAVEALGPDRVLGITMPSQYSSTETKSDAYLLSENLGIRFKESPIKRSVQASIDEFRLDPEIAGLPEDVTEENIQARERMKRLMAYSNKLGGIVLNTGNKTELALDNCTLYGDMVGGFSVLGDVDKDRVYDLARYINLRAGRELIPVSTIDRIPSAELKPNQSDANVMGADPQIIAPMMRAIVEEGLSVKDTIERFKDQFSEELIVRSHKRLDRSEYKRRQAAPAIRVTPHAFGQGRRVPMNHGYLG